MEGQLSTGPTLSSFLLGKKLIIFVIDKVHYKIIFVYSVKPIIVFVNPCINIDWAKNILRKKVRKLR